MTKSSHEYQDTFFNTQKYKISSIFSTNENIVLYEGDALDGLKSVPDDIIKLIISSPPYNVGKSYEVVKRLEDYLDGIRPILNELIRVLAPDGSLCWQVGNYVENSEVFPLDIFYYPIFKEAGLKLRNRMIWHFNHGLHASKRFSGRYEVLLWFTKTDNYTFNLDAVRVPAKYPGKTNYKPGKNYGMPSGNPLGKNPSDFWEIIAQDWEKEIWEIPNVKANHPEKTNHPCQFPIELVQRCVLACTNENDWLLDPFSGVGSAMLGGLMHSRKVMGCEINQEYIDLTKHRIDLFHNGSLKIRPIGKPVYKPTGREKVSQVPDSWKNNYSYHDDDNGKLF